jgi:ketosteroid isomerase-like protein
VTAWSSDEFAENARSYSRTQANLENELPSTNRLQLARDAYRAYESGDRELIESLLADDLVFYSPPDPGIDREQYFERCWPNAGMIDSFEFVRLIEAGDEVVVTYESTKTDGKRFRNTEVLTFDGDRIRQVEVYFGWDLE